MFSFKYKIKRLFTFKWYHKEMSVWYNIDNIFHNLIWPFEKIIQKAVRMVEYFPIIWGSEDWDYSYFFTLMKYKIGRMRKCILKNNIISDSDKVASEMLHVETLIQRYLDGNFCVDLKEAHEKKWGKHIDEFVPIDVNGKKMYEWNMSREKATTPELIEQERKEQHEVYDKEHKEEEKTFEEIFSCLKNYSRGWWD